VKGGVMSLNSSLKKSVCELGLAIQALYEKGKVRLPGEMHIDDLKSYISSGDETSEFILLGALSVLSTLGLVTIEPKGLVMVTSRHAHFALGSLSKFLTASMPAIDSPLSKHPTQSIVEFTRILETIREHTSGVDKTPLHSRRIVNLLIKGRQHRESGIEDVYLFVHRADWDEYHLVGYSRHSDDQDDEYVARLAMQEHLGLRPDQYELDALRKPDDVSLTLVSKPNGVRTEYTFCLRVVRWIKVPMNPSDSRRLRWFTWGEILRRTGQQDEVIMESTVPVMRSLGDLASIPVCVPLVDGVLASEDLPVGADDGVQWQEVVLIGSIWLVACLLIFVPLTALPWPSQPSALLTNLANLAKILGYVLPVTSLPKIYRITKRLISRRKGVSRK